MDKAMIGPLNSQIAEPLCVIMTLQELQDAEMWCNQILKSFLMTFDSIIVRGRKLFLDVERVRKALHSLN